MRKNTVVICVAISVATLIIGHFWRKADPGNETSFILYFFGWIATLLTVGYASTPTGSIFGKVSFAFVCIMVIGIAFKILHYTAANELIVVGLLGIVITYSVMWLKERKTE
jgi:hypothetical protein